MKSNTKAQLSVLILFFTLIGGCIQENPNLVNPQEVKFTVKARFLNLAADRGARILKYDSETETESVEFASLSKSSIPPADSVFMEVWKNGSLEFDSQTKVKFGRYTNNVFIALPSPRNAERNKPVDTLLTLSSFYTIYPLEIEAWLKVFNAYPDSTVTFTITQGCPNGSAIASSIGYRSQSSSKEIRSGVIPFSLVKNSSTGSELINLYSIELKTDGQYAIIISEDANGNIKPLLLDELDSTASALKEIPIIAERETQVRAVNFSKNTIDVRKEPYDDIALGLSPLMISPYATLSACGALTADTIATYIGGGISSDTLVSLDVSKKYTVLVFDSSPTETLTLMASPPVINEALGNRAIIRGVHGAYLTKGALVSVGARNDATKTDGYNSGQLLANDLLFGEITEPVIVTPGYLPLTMFSSEPPKEMLYCCYSYVEPGKNYLLVITANANGPYLTLIEEGNENETITALPQGVLSSFVHATPGIDSLRLSAEPALSSIKMFYGSTLATVLPPESNLVSFNSTNVNVNLSLGKRLLVISAGNQDGIETMFLSSDPMGADKYSFKRRFINACKEAPELMIVSSTFTSNDTLVRNLPYLSVDNVGTENRETKKSYYFVNSTTDKLLDRFQEIYMSLG